MITCVFGKRGVGKTTYLKSVVKNSIYSCIIIDTLREYEDIAERFYYFEDMYKNFKGCFTPNNENDLIILLMDLERIYHKYPINIIISEIDYWTNSYYLPEAVMNLFRYSRHYNFNIFCDCRTPMELNRKISALADIFIIFKITEPRYLEYFKLYGGQDLINKIKKLKLYEYLTLNI